MTDRSLDSRSVMGALPAKAWDASASRSRADPSADPAPSSDPDTARQRVGGGLPVGGRGSQSVLLELEAARPRRRPSMPAASISSIW